MEDSIPFTIHDSDMQENGGHHDGETIQVGNLITYTGSNEITVTPGKSADIDSASLFPNITNTLNLAVKECGV